MISNDVRHPYPYNINITSKSSEQDEQSVCNLVTCVETVICADRSKYYNILRSNILYCGVQIPMFQRNILLASSGRRFTITAKTTPRLRILFHTFILIGIDDSRRYTKR